MKPRDAVARAEDDSGTGDPGLTASRAAIEDIGAGRPLEPDTRAFFERRLGADLSAVRVHTGDKADRAARGIHARAYTYGSAIAFAAGQYNPGTPDGRELLAHELTHVLQQNEGAQRTVMRDATGGGTSDEVSPPDPLEIPANKARHTHQYAALATKGGLKRPQGYDREEAAPQQVANWNSFVTFDEARIKTAGRIPADADLSSIQLKVTRGNSEVSKLSDLIEGDIVAGLKIPQWNKAGTFLTEGNDRYQVDHIVELQLGGPDAADNYELFRGANNMSVGGAMRGAIERSIRAYLLAEGAKDSVDQAFKTRYPPNATGIANLKADKAIRFRRVAAGRDSRSSNRREASGSFWTRAEIRALDHIRELLDAPDRNRDGTATRLALYSPTGQLKMGVLNHRAVRNAPVAIDPTPTQASLISGLKIVSGTREVGAAGAGPPGSLLAEWDLNPKVFAVPDLKGRQLTIPLEGVTGLQHASRLVFEPTSLDASLNAFSPINLSDIRVLGGRLTGSGLIHPTLPFLEGITLPARLDGRGLRMSHTLDVKRLVEKLRIPGIVVEESTLTLFIDEAGAGAEGMMGFTIPKVGSGLLTATLATGGAFELAGGFNFDPALFDQASIQMGYRSTGFFAKGTIGISKPNKIKGLRAASASVDYNALGLTIEGTAQPDIPGVESATLRFVQSPEGYRIEGDAVLKQIPGLKGGSIGIILDQRGDGWKLGARGEVEPDIPGVSTMLRASYDDGAFTIGGEVAFAAGIFTGRVDVGATNRPLDADGKPQAGAPTGDIKAYGSGILTARLTDWLQGTVGIKRRPTGQLLISGKLGLPGAIQVFGRYPEPPWQRELLPIPTVNIPIFGGGVGSFTIGISATIGGSLGATAYVGPGMLEQAELGIIDFDPTVPDSLHVTGQAAFVVPAYAGMHLGIDAGISAGAGIVSVTGGMNVGADLGIEARAAAEAIFDWTPNTGLNLNATLSASMQPKLKFSVGAFVKADVSLLITDFTIYRKDWKLAEFEYGPALQVGISVPLGYSSQRGLDFDFNKIEFQLPSIGARDLITGLLDSQGSEQVSDPDD